MSVYSLADHLMRPITAWRCVVGLCAALGSIAAPVLAQPSMPIQQVADRVAHQLQQHPPSATPYDLFDVWHMGLTGSPYAKLILSRFAESQEQRLISRGGLWPQLSASYSQSRIHGWRQQPNWAGQAVRSDLRYNSTHFGVQLQQPLFNAARYAEYQRGIAVSNQGQAQLALDQQTLSLDIAQSYFATLLAYENWAMQRERVTFYSERLRSFEQLLRGGQATQLEVEETAARLATAQADVLVAADEVRITARQLESYIGVQPHALRPLPPQWHDEALEHDLPSLLEQGVVRNKAIQAAHQEVLIHEARLKAARSQYFPTVSLGISLGKADSEDLATLSQRSNTFAVGLNVSIPIFTGGYTSAATSQAHFQLQAARHRYDGAIAKARAEIQQYYGLYTSGASRVAAMQRAMESSQRSLDSVLKSFSVGAANNIDVLDAKDQLIQTRYDYYQARLDVLSAQLRLSAAVGQPLHQTVRTLSAQHFQGQAIHLPSPLGHDKDPAQGWVGYDLSPVVSPPQAQAPTAPHAAKTTLSWWPSRLAQ